VRCLVFVWPMKTLLLVLVAVATLTSCAGYGVGVSVGATVDGVDYKVGVNIQAPKPPDLSKQVVSIQP
jgi:hypothetical protein